MAEIILIEDVVSNKYRPEEETYYNFNLSKPGSDYLTALQDYIVGEKFTEDVKAKIGDYDISLESVTVSSDYMLYWEGSLIMGGHEYPVHQYAYLNQDSNKFYAETGVNNGDVLKFYIEQDTPTPGAIPLKGTMEQIAEVLEQKASIEHEDKGYLDTDTYEHRIVVALEKYYNVEYEDKGNLNEKDYLQRLLEVAKNI